MHFDKLIRTPVGADSSRPSPIYRPRWIFRYPDEKVKKHYRALFRGRALGESAQQNLPSTSA